VQTLTDYLDLATLEKLQQRFSATADAPVWICGPGGASVLAGGPRRPAEGAPAVTVPVTVDDAEAGRLCAHVADDDRRDHVESLLRLMADVLGRLCAGQQQHRARAGELAALFAITAEFGGQRDLQGVLDLVAKTVVDTLRAKGCSIRLLNPARTELVIQAVANLSAEYLDKGPILVSESRIDQEVLRTGRPVYVADQRTDPRVLYPAEARREGIVSALCAPLAHQGRTEGVVHVYTARPHRFNWFEVSLLQAIATQAAAAIAAARWSRQAADAANLRRHLRAASEVQRQLTPPDPPRVDGFDFGVVWVPCFELAGDFYAFIDLPPDNVGLAICDVAGKGVRASLLMASVRASLRAHAQGIYEMSDVLERVNRDLCADTREGDFATMFYAVIDAPARRLTYANAGHPPPMLFRDGQRCDLDTRGTILGIDPDQRWPHEHFTLRAGDVVLAYTDGLSDALNFDDEPFGRRRIEAAAAAAIADGRDANGIAQHVLWAMRRFAGLQTRFDDLTLIAIRVQ
jgi:sigma-B regulation protein RsbU (phosphoserine phosphatase)